MTTQEVADRLVELCRQGKMKETQEELYADNVTSTEADDSMGPRTVEGIEAIKKKGEIFSSMIEEFHGATISDPEVVGKCFSIGWTMDVTMKGQGRRNMEEICVYKVEDGKIVSEQFFY